MTKDRLMTLVTFHQEHPGDFKFTQSRLAASDAELAGIYTEHIDAVLQEDEFANVVDGAATRREIITISEVSKGQPRARVRNACRVILREQVL